MLGSISLYMIIILPNNGTLCRLIFRYRLCFEIATYCAEIFRGEWSWFVEGVTKVSQKLMRRRYSVIDWCHTDVWASPALLTCSTILKWCEPTRNRAAHPITNADFKRIRNDFPTLNVATGGSSCATLPQPCRSDLARTQDGGPRPTPRGEDRAADQNVFVFCTREGGGLPPTSDPTTHSRFGSPPGERL
jgi:hypothetical protein